MARSVASMRVQRPARRQRAVDRGIERALVAHDAGDDVAEERGVGVAVLLAVDLLAEAVATRTRPAPRAASPRRCPSGRAPAPRQAAPRRAGWPAAPASLLGLSRGVMPIRDRASRGARSWPAPPRPPPRPCSRSPTRARAQAWSSILHGEDAVADGQRLVDRDVHDGARRIRRRRCRSGWSRRG